MKWNKIATYYLVLLAQTPALLCAADESKTPSNAPLASLSEKREFQIKAIEFEGISSANSSVASINFSQDFVGKTYNDRIGQKIISTIYQTKEVDQIDLYERDGALVIVCKSKPMLASLDFSLRGPQAPYNDSVKKVLEEALAREGLLVGGRFDQNGFDRALRSTQEQCKLNFSVKEMIPKVEIIKILGDQAVAVKVGLWMGRRVSLKQINLSGVSQPFEESFYKHVPSPNFLSRKWLPQLVSQPIDLQFVENVKRVLAESYTNEGVWDAQLADPLVLFSPSQNAMEICYIAEDEGTKNLWGQFKISGDQETLKWLKDFELPDLEGKPYQRKDLEKIKNKIRIHLNRLGFQRASVESYEKERLDDEVPTIDVKVVCQAHKRCYVRRIDFQGDLEVNNKNLLHVLNCKQGSLLKSEMLNDDRQTLSELGCFRNVQCQVVPVAGKSNLMDVIYHLEKSNDDELSATLDNTGVSLSTLKVKASYGTQNFLRNGRSFNVEMKFAPQVYAVDKATNPLHESQGGLVPNLEFLKVWNYSSDFNVSVRDAILFGPWCTFGLDGNFYFNQKNLETKEDGTNNGSNQTNEKKSYKYRYDDDVHFIKQQKCGFGAQFDFKNPISRKQSLKMEVKWQHGKLLFEDHVFNYQLDNPDVFKNQGKPLTREDVLNAFQNIDTLNTRDDRHYFDRIVFSCGFHYKKLASEFSGFATHKTTLEVGARLPFDAFPLKKEPKLLSRVSTLLNADVCRGAVFHGKFQHYFSPFTLFFKETIKFYVDGCFAIAGSDLLHPKDMKRCHHTWYDDAFQNRGTLLSSLTVGSPDVRQSQVLYFSKKNNLNHLDLKNEETQNSIGEEGVKLAGGTGYAAMSVALKLPIELYLPIHPTFRSWLFWRALVQQKDRSVETLQEIQKLFPAASGERLFDSATEELLKRLAFNDPVIPIIANFGIRFTVEPPISFIGFVNLDLHFNPSAFLGLLLKKSDQWACSGMNQDDKEESFLEGFKWNFSLGRQAFLG